MGNLRKDHNLLEWFDYYLNNGSMPSDCYEEMEEFGYIEMKQSVIQEWEFQCDWEFDKAEREKNNWNHIISTKDMVTSNTIWRCYPLFTTKDINSARMG